MDICKIVNGMREQIISILSRVIDQKIIEDLVDTYASVKDDFIQSNYSESQTKSGKFVENVFRALNFIHTGQSIHEIKLGQMNKISSELEKSTPTKHPESIRLLIPNIAKSIYMQRSKLGSVHQKSISPDFIDAKLTVASSDWIIAEFLRLSYSRDTEHVQKLIQNVVREYIPTIQKKGDEIFIDAQVDCANEILIRLHYFDDGLTRRELGKHMKESFTPYQITKSLIVLKKTKKIFHTTSKKFIIANSARAQIVRKIAEISRSR